MDLTEVEDIKKRWQEYTELHKKHLNDPDNHDGALSHWWISGSIGYGGASLVAQMVKNLPVMWETRVQSLVWEDPLEKGMATHSFSCLENSLNRGAWRATVHGVIKSWT